MEAHILVGELIPPKMGSGHDEEWISYSCWAINIKQEGKPELDKSWVEGIIKGIDRINQDQAVAIAKQHLQQHVHHAFPNVDFFSLVEKTEVVEGECEANKYWERWGQEPIESPQKHSCRIVRFYYPGACEGSYLAVYVDKNTNEVIGGTQTR